jgi:hypothetical protein
MPPIHIINRNYTNINVNTSCEIPNIINYNINQPRDETHRIFERSRQRHKNESQNNNLLDNAKSNTENNNNKNI